MNTKMIDIYIKENPEMQLIGSAIKLVLQERKRQDSKWGANRNLDDMAWLTILIEEVGESAEAILKHLPSKQEEITHITAVALAWLECVLRATELRMKQSGQWRKLFISLSVPKINIHGSG